MTMTKTPRTAGLTGLLFLALGGGALAAGPSCADGVIKIGSVSTITGPVDFSDTPNAAAAVFSAVNAAGGINGCRIDYIKDDDRGDPQVATQAARSLIDNDGVVAMVGSASLLDCSMNAARYQRSGIMSVPGLGTDPVCFGTAVIKPVNVGPYVLTTALLYYASHALHAKKICIYNYVIGGWQEAMENAIRDWEKIEGMKPHILDMTLPVQGDFTPFVIRARDEGCDAIVTNQTEPGIVQWVKTADAQGLSGIPMLFLTSGYTAAAAKALADTRQNVYVGTELEPYVTDIPENVAWRAAMNKAGLPNSAFSQAGYLSAEIFVDVLKGIDGPVTRKSVAAALHTMQPYKTALLGAPYLFDRKGAPPPRFTKIAELKRGNWEIVTTDWLLLPEVK